MSVLLCARVGKRISALTVRCASVCIERVKWLAFLLFVFVFVAATSCTTLVNRRDLYSPEPAPDSLEAARQWYGVTTTSTTTTIRTQTAGETAPDFVLRPEEPLCVRAKYAARLVVARDGSGDAESPVSRKEVRFYSRDICFVHAAQLCPAGVCALRFSTTIDGVATNATSRPFHGR